MQVVCRDRPRGLFCTVNDERRTVVRSEASSHKSRAEAAREADTRSLNLKVTCPGLLNSIRKERHELERVAPSEFSHRLTVNLNG